MVASAVVGAWVVVVLGIEADPSTYQIKNKSLACISYHLNALYEDRLICMVELVHKNEGRLTRMVELNPIPSQLRLFIFR